MLIGESVKRDCNVEIYSLRKDARQMPNSKKGHGHSREGWSWEGTREQCHV